MSHANGLASMYRTDVLTNATFGTMVKIETTTVNFWLNFKQVAMKISSTLTTVKKQLLKTR